MRKKIAVGVLGCTGAVGQKFISLLAEHPWFEVKEIIASEKSANKVYVQHVNWKETTAIPEKIGSMKIKKCFDNLQAKILFSGLDSSVAGEVETYYAKRGHIVISNSKNHRMDEDVPLVVPEVNIDHMALVTEKKGSGCIVTNPNCAVVMLAVALFPIFKKFGLGKVMITTMQAISGAGYPGVPSLDILGNVIPHIQDEEEKIQTEILKIFGNYQGNKIKLANFKVSALCNRVPVYNGHTLAVSFSTCKKATAKDMIKSLYSMKRLDLPSSPQEVLQYYDDKFRPQPLLDVNTGNGMTVSVGNLRSCNVLDWKFTVLGHNTIRGAAGVAILNAEYIVENNLC
ncbi:Aspartate-semialdehyde dehydrogenase [Gammaproteobacteria bacterium]